MENTNCPNCSHSIEDHFCTNCGEKRFKRIQMKDVWSDFISNLINIEGPILNTVKDLSIRPGNMIRDYLNGNRNKYYKPFQFYILATTLYFIFFYLWGNQMLEMFSDLGANYNTSASSEQIAKFQEKMSEFQQNNMRIFTFLQVPIYAWLIWLFFRKKSKQSFTETLVASLYIMAQALLFGVISTLFVFVHSSLPMIINTVLLLFYLPWVFKQLYNEPTFTTILKSLAIIIIGFALYGILMGIISLVWLILISN